MAVQAPAAARAGDLLLRVVLPLAGFWVFLALAGLADYERGRERAVALLVAAVGLVLLPQVSPRATRVVAVVLGVVAVLLLGYRTTQALDARADGRSPTIDIGQTTIAAVQLVREGRNPYVERIDYFGDQARPGGTGFDHFAGFKYGPVMTAAYYPGVRAAGPGGYFLTSLLALAVTAAAAAWWAASAGGPAAGAGAGALVLAIPFAKPELFEAGINDLVPVGLLVLAFAARSRGGGLLPGILLGLSIGAKLLPGGLLALPLVLAVRTRRWTALVVAAAIALLAHAGALVQSPRELLSNLVLFNLSRPLDRTGLLDTLPESTRPLVKVLSVLAIVGTTWLVARWAAQRPTRREEQAAVAALCCVALAALFAGSTVLHRNWLFWIAPFLAVGLAVRVWGSEDGQPGDGAGADERQARSRDADDEVVRPPALAEAGQRPEDREDR